MPSERWQRIQDALWAALQRTPGARGAFLTETYAADPELLAEVRSLLRAHEQSGAFLGGPISVPAGTATADGSGEIRRLAEEMIDFTTDERASWLDRTFPNDQHQVRRELEALLEAYRLGLEFVHRRDPPSAQDPLIGSTTSHYHIVEKLGEGGMGVVYQARDTRLDRIVALKFVHPRFDGDQEAKERLVREARAASALDHVNICTIHEIGETDAGQVFIAMACYAGETLQKELERRALPLEDALHYAVEVAQGLEKAHEQGLVHRDIKPANVMVTRDGVVKLLDFGLARTADVSRTNAGPVRATVAYMSPEQARGEMVDHRTDIWSFGVVLYEMLAGRRPFRGESAHAMVQAILNDEPDPVVGLGTEMPAVLEQVIGRALAKRPAERYERTRELVGDLQRARRIFARSGTAGAATAASGATTRPGRGQLLPEGERVQATVVVSKLSSPVDVTARPTPEDFDRAIRTMREHMFDVVRRHGGVVNAFDGEELVTLFGVPAPREDDCVRAARASLELHACVRERAEAGAIPAIQVCTGMDTGLVVARHRGQAAHPYRVVGRPLRVAVRLALHAGAGEVLASPESRQLLVPSFETEEGTPLQRKGAAQSMTPARIVEASPSRSRLDAADPAWLTSYAGREAEMETLRRCLRRVQAGEGQLLTVMGEAGLGKSRLLYEFREGLVDGRVAIVKGRCSSSRDSIPFQPFIDALRDRFLIGPGTAESEGADRVVAEVREHTPELVVYIPLYLHLLSMPSEAHPLPEHLKGEHLHRALLEALVAVFTLSARERPSALFLEDWHWSDEASRNVLDELVELLPAHRLLVVVTFRPEYAPDWAHPSHQTAVRLRPLEEGSSTAIIESALRATHLPEGVGALLHKRAEGNPFFLEEICRALREEGILRVEDGRVIPVRSMETLELPNTVQAIVRTRLHRLDREARRVLRLASVAGHVFTHDLLRHAMEGKGGSNASLDGSLEVLRSAGLIRQTDVLPDATYRFRHGLTQEAAYDTLLPHQRKRMHGLVGRAIEECFADRLDERAEVLAHHFAEAEHWRKAVRYGRLAAERTYRLGQLPDTIALYERARESLERLPEDAERRQTLIELLLRRERLYEQLAGHTEQQAAIDELFALLDREGDPETLAETYIRQGDLYILQGGFAEAEDALNEALRVSRATAHLPGEQKALRSMGFLRWHQDRHQEAVSINDELVALDREQGDVEVLVTDLLNLLTVLRRTKDFARGLVCVEELLILSERVEDPARHLPLYNNICDFYRGMGDHARALHFLDRALEIADQHQYLGAYTYQLAKHGQIFLEQGRVEDSIRCYEEAVGLSRNNPSLVGAAGSGHSGLLGFAGLLHRLGELLLALGRDEEALPHLEEAAAAFDRLNDPETEALLRSKVAFLHEGQGRVEAARISWEQVRELSRRRGDLAGECQALEGLGRTARGERDVERALSCYREALQLAERTGDEARQGPLHNTLGILAWRRGAYDAALAHYEQALRIYGARDDPIHMGLMLNSLGATLQKLGRPEEAVGRLEEAIRLHRRTEQRRLEAYALGVLGDVHLGMGRLAKAVPCYVASLRLRPDLGDRRGEGWMLHRLARSYAAQGFGERSRTAAARATSIAAEIGDDELSRTCRPFTGETGA